MNRHHIGIVACSAEGAALCYRTICNEAQETMGEHMHPEVSMIPFIHIAEAVAGEATKRGYTSVGLTGTKYLMTSPVYPVVLDGVGIECMVPDRGEREQIDFIIFKELVNGIFPEESRLYLNEVIGKFRARGAEAVILGCTEIPLIVRPDDCPLPTLDSTRLLARAALARVFSGEPSIGV